MLSADKVLSPGVRRMLPDDRKNYGYVKVKAGDVLTITDVIYNVHPAKDKNGNVLENPTTKDPILNVTAYVCFDDGTLTTFDGKIAIGQLASETGDVPTVVGVYHTRLADPVKVEIIEVMQRYGTKDYPKFAFDPLA